jgi:hypothetical protein
VLARFKEASKRTLRNWVRKNADKIATAIGLVILIPLFAVLTVPLDGPGYCIKAFRESNPDFARGVSVVRRIWTRTQRDHWVSALIVQPYDLSQSPSTVVCHFARANYVSPQVEIYDEDRSSRLKDISTSNYNPVTWFK